MTYEELVKLAKESYCTTDASKVTEHVAIQFNITGEAAGAFYLEIKDGQVFVEPYEYYDRDVIVTCDAETLIKIADGKIAMEAAYLTGKIKAEGNLGKALLLKELTKPEKKVRVKKPAVKKETAKKETVKKATTKKKIEK